MLTWKLPILIAVLFVVGGALYIRLRWCRSPHAYRAMIVLAVCYCIAGVLIGAWALHFALPENDHHSTIPDTAVAKPAVSDTPIAKATSDDGTMIAKYLSQTRDVHSPDVCDVIGFYADTVALYRELGHKPDELRQTLHTAIEKKATERFLATSDMSPLEGVIDREIDYAYDNRGLGATQVRSYWVNSCVAQRRS